MILIVPTQCLNQSCSQAPQAAAPLKLQVPIGLLVCYYTGMVVTEGLSNLNIGAPIGPLFYHRIETFDAADLPGNVLHSVSHPGQGITDKEL
jgi:hypothetical protein